MITENEKFGTMKEYSVLLLFEKNDIILTKRDYKYDIIDFYYDTNTRFYEIELKTRKTTLHQYPTTILAKNKILYYIRKKNNGEYDKTPAFFIIFGFPTENNGDDYEYYYIQYTKSKFKDFDIFENRFEDFKKYYKIPIDMLRPIDDLISILKNSTYTL